MGYRSFFALMRKMKAPAPIVSMQGRKCFTRYHPGLRAVSVIVEIRAFIVTDNGATRPKLNVLAWTCSGAMFPRRPTPRFTVSRLSLDERARYSPFPRIVPILLALGPLVKDKMQKRGLDNNHCENRKHY